MKYSVWEKGETKDDALEIEADDEFEAACKWAEESESTGTEHVVVSVDGVDKNFVVYAEMSIDYSAYEGS